MPALWEYHNLTDINTNIVQNTWYTPLPTVRHVKVAYVRFRQINNGGTEENLEARLIIDGKAKLRRLYDVPSGVRRHLLITMVGGLGHASQPFMLGARDWDHSGSVHTKSFEVQIRQTTAVDPVSAQIETNVIYHKLERMGG